MDSLSLLVIVDDDPAEMTVDQCAKPIPPWLPFDPKSLNWSMDNIRRTPKLIHRRVNNRVDHLATGAGLVV